MNDNDQEIHLRATAERIKLHCQLNEAVALREILAAPGIKTAADAKAAVDMRIHTLLLLERQLHGGCPPGMAAPSAAPASGDEPVDAGSWPAATREDICH